MKLCRRFRVLVMVLGVLALAACSANGGGVQPTPNKLLAPAAGGAPATAAAYPATTPEVESYPVGTPEPDAYPNPPAAATSPAAEGKAVDPAMVDLAKKDLGKRLSVTVDQISVVTSGYMDWPDSSLGCPKPGIAYAQVVTPGYRIVLGQGQKQYDYHTDLKAALVLCTP